jgi:DNA gyrase subunit A
MDDNELIQYFIKRYGLTDLQASFVIHNDLTKISPYQVSKMKVELEKLSNEANDLYNKIVNEDALVNDVKEDLIRIKKTYGQPRRCKIVSESVITGIPEGKFKIILTENNYLCKIDINNPKFPKFKNDKPKIITVAENTDNIIIFDDQGKSYKLPVHKITLNDGRSNGIDIRILVKGIMSGIVAIMPEEKLNKYAKRIDKPFFLTCVSRKGLIKKLDLNAFSGNI